ncbi:hypothetical protein MSIMFI_04922 [Mycobacterium simulans]|nr:hypothetical protein [Mycobacterium simulans]SON63392.1 hypothetical protein MSIMFI_04922 [Mycobacterium simulans]
MTDRHVVTARFLFSTKGDADHAADQLDRLTFVGLLATEFVIEEAR